jgi:4-amino-4-deoxy-L-arabinose transferase-like glycosyltransferase
MNENIILRFKKIFSNPRSIIGIATILFLPLLFIGTRTSHDWGDDFAQYIHQAKNIVNGTPQSETGYIYNQLNYIGPQAYPIGFPLLLAPVYAVAGNSIVAFTTYISVIYILVGLLMVVFYRKYFPSITALLLAFVFLYHPQMILFKGEVLSDIPFTALLVLNFILYQKLKPGNLLQMILLSVLTGFMLALRPAGIVFVVAIITDQFVLLFKRKTEFKDFGLHTAILTISPILIYFILNTLIFNIPSGGSIRDYLIFFNSGNLLQVIPANLVHHVKVLRYFLVPETGNFKGFSYLFGLIMIVMILLGFVKRLIKSPEVIDWFFVFYILMLLFFPNNKSAFRLMIPLGFIFLFYAAIGIKSIKLIVEMTVWKKAVVIGVVILLTFVPGIIGIARTGNNIIEGPQQESSVEAFKYISKNVPAEAVIVFAKPRALALYSGCQGMADPFTTDLVEVNKQVKDAKATYLLIQSELTPETMKQYVRVMQNRITKQFENKDFVLYKINSFNPSAHR